MYLKEVIDTKKNIKFNNIKLNSKDIEKGDLFIPFGGIENRNKYIPDVIKKGCSAIITNEFYKNKKVFLVKDIDKEIIKIFNIYYNYPLKNTKLIGVTGTDGKTTVAGILSDILEIPSIGTNGFKLNNKYFELNNTTPSLDVLYAYFNKTRNFKYLVMEVSSEAYLTNRIGSLQFDIAILTDITKDHLDKHKSLENYISCKLELFKNSKLGIINLDSKYADLFKNKCSRYLSYGFNKKSNLRIIKYKLYIDYSIIWLKFNKKIYKIKYNLVGKFNVYNISSCILTLTSLGYNMDDIIRKIKNIKKIPGRMDVVYNNKYKIIIDYAHTEESTKNVLMFYRNFSKNIITIVGCAGGRYKEKRNKIGKIVLNYSKYVIFTMDDPRYEKVSNIIKEMIGDSKKKNYFIIENRKDAIQKGVSLCKKNYILLILGKGFDNYMLINSKKIPYSDYEVTSNLINKCQL